MRAESIGVSVKETISETPIANAIVRPNEFMNRPDDAAHERDGEEHGHERERRREDGQADLLRGVHRGLEGHDLLLLDEAGDVLEHDDGVVDDDTDRQRQRQQREELSVKPIAYMSANVEMIDVGIAIAAMSVERRLPRKRSTTSAARIRPRMRCSCTVSTAASMNCDLSRTISIV